ncbi:putative holin [Bacillus phage AR9]|nr:holin [Bacillus phage AR9]AMS01166.1 putative holin [Bacillus phage AR9]
MITMPNHTDDTIVRILWVVVISFFSAFAKELNDRAKNPKETFLLFLSEVLLNGVCGAITGVLAFNLTDNIYTISAISAIGGLMGMNLIKYITKLGIVYVAALRNINVDDLSKINLDDEKPSEEEKKENTTEEKRES